MTTTKAFRIWAQGATDQVAHQNYLAALLPHMRACCDPDFELEFKTTTPSVTTVHALSEHRFSREVIRGAIRAERENYDVFFMNYFTGRRPLRCTCVGEYPRPWPRRGDPAACLHDGPEARPACDQSCLHPDLH